MNVAEAAINAAVAPPVQSANLQVAEQQSQPKPLSAEFGGFHLSYDPQNRELFLVLTNVSTGEVQDQIPGFQTISNRRNSTSAAPATVAKLGPDASTSAGSSAPVSTPQGGAPGPSAAPAAAGAPGAASAARGATVNIAS